GTNVGAQSYFNALATMVLSTRGILIMLAGSSMVLTGRLALEASGGVGAEDELAIGGFERIMGPSGQGQYYARDLQEGYEILLQHYQFTYCAPHARPARRARARPGVGRRALRCRVRSPPRPPRPTKRKTSPASATSSTIRS